MGNQLKDCNQSPEARALDEFRAYLHENRDMLSLLYRWGDGQGAYLMEVLHAELGDGASRDSSDPRLGRRRKKIPHHIRREVYERDRYRCVQCGTHIDLTLDHITPHCIGGEDSVENLQVLCRICNSKKGAQP